MLDRLRATTDEIDIGFLVYNAGASHVTGEFINWPLEDVEKVVRLTLSAKPGSPIISARRWRSAAAAGSS
jgi:hypothetical protein